MNERSETLMARKSRLEAQIRRSPRSSSEEKSLLEDVNKELAKRPNNLNDREPEESDDGIVY